MIGVPLEALNKNLDENTKTLCKSKFHMQVLTSWIKLHQNDPKETDEILNEYIILNKHILVDNKMIQLNFFGQNNNNIKIAHILKEDGKSKNMENINQDNNMQLSTLKYNSLVSSIPKNWKKQLKNKCNHEHIEKAKQKHTDPEVKIDGKMINLFKLTTKKFIKR